MKTMLAMGLRKLWSCWKCLKVWHAFILVRIVSTFYIQPGYIHPDEFFQSVEVISGDVLDIEVHRTWEFNAEAPVRSIVLPYLIYVPCYAVLHILSLLGVTQLNTANILLAPRICVLFLSVGVDYIVYRILKLYRGLDVHSAMLVYTTSYVTLVYHTRTLSNTLESFLFIALLCCIQKEIQRILRFFKAFPRSKLTQCSRTEEPETLGIFEWIQPPHIFLMASCVVAGFFNRPTFLLFAYTPFLYYVFDGVLPQTFSDFRTAIKLAYRKLWLAVLFSLPCLLLFVHIDTMYYKNWREIIEMHELPFLEHLHSAVYNFVFEFALKDLLAITPLNFISYNTKSDNLATHGTHNRFTHFFVNQPILFGTLFICVLFDAFVLIATKSDSKFRRTSPLDRSDTKFWLHSYLVPLTLLSIFPHQEPRFLIPLLLPLVILYGHLIFGKKSVPFFKISWIVLNVFGFVFYGVLHQGGIVKSIDYVRRIALDANENTTVHVIYSHTYMPPKHLFLIKNDSKIEDEFQMRLNQKYSSRSRSAPLKFKRYILPTEYTPQSQLTVYDLQGKAFHHVEEKIDIIYRRKCSSAPVVYLVTPATLEPALCLNDSLSFSYKFVKQFTGHLSMEDPPTLSYLQKWSDRGFPCSLCLKEKPCKLHPFHILSPVLGLNVYKVYKK